jgi:hypothetical protein
MQYNVFLRPVMTKQRSNGRANACKEKRPQHKTKI